MAFLIIVLALLGGAACRRLNNTVEDTVKESSSLPSCPVCGIHTWVQIGNNCYQVFGNPLTFSSAEVFCRAHVRGGRLASIHSASDNDELRKLMKSSTSRAWFGGIHLHAEKQFIWSDGSEFNYQNWAPGEPNKWAGKELCMEMYGNGQWNDLSCDQKQPFICQYRMTALELQKAAELPENHA
ncbi:proteoglycan 3 [Ambystoma mexicanum]|uniref:proteoglycan 3 n=1 Tax=Ambystoma mexicanum TaxID=8296 RepID=UPI0037E94F96